MATGLGKSMVANQLIANEFDRNPDQEILVMAHMTNEDPLRKKILNAIREHRGESEIDAVDFLKLAREKMKMVQMDDMGHTIAWLAALPPHVCINELVISPTHNRIYQAGKVK